MQWDRRVSRWQTVAIWGLLLGALAIVGLLGRGEVPRVLVGLAVFASLGTALMLAARTRSRRVVGAATGLVFATSLLLSLADGWPLWQAAAAAVIVAAGMVGILVISVALVRSAERAGS